MKDCNIKLDLLKRLRYNNEKFCKLGISKNCLEIAPDNKQNFFGSACYPCLKLKQQKKYIERKMINLKKQIEKNENLEYKVDKKDP